ncbi:hypothetical protein [Porphyromonas levii]|uniref:hypothetical protein n=1 Tax=Porphyromonas levii TaxID=28114 RepID=UPI00142FAC0D|nr:hypothetical protein [Porphyromonas levii]
MRHGKLSDSEMMNLYGGVSAEEYCRDLRDLMAGDYAENEWTDEQWRNAERAYQRHCKH